MSVDEVTSVYVGGLPYEANEDMLRDAFEYYGTIVAVKVINDHNVKGKCYGFVTFTHPKAAEHAIAGMDGKTVGGRVVRVNEVRTRGHRDFGRDDFRRDRNDFRRDRDDFRREPRRFGREPYWDRRDRERSYERDRDPYHDRDSDRSRDHDREIDYEHGGFNRENDYSMDRERDHEADERRPRDLEADERRPRDLEADERRPRDLEADEKRPRDLDHAEEMNNMDSDNDKDKEHVPRKRFSRPKGRDSRSRDISSSSDDIQNEGKHQLAKAIQMREDLENEVNEVRNKVATKEQQIADLQKRAQKLEDELATARKVSSERQLAVTDLYKHFLQLQDYNDRVKTAEQKLQSLVESAMVELDMAEDATNKDGSYENGVV